MEENKKNKVPNVPTLGCSFSVYRLRDVCSVVGGGTPDTSNKDYWDGNIIWFTPSEVGKSKYVKSSTRRITEKGYKNCSAKLLAPNSILLSSRATIGESSINTLECCTNQGFQSLTKIKINIEYLYYYLQTYIIRKSLIRRACGSTFLEISNHEVGKTKIYLPDEIFQNKVALILSAIDKRIEAQNKIIKELDSLRKTIIYRLIKRSYDAGNIVLIEKCVNDYSYKTMHDDKYPVLSSTSEGIFFQNDYFKKEASSDDTTGYKKVPYGYCTYRSMSDTGKFFFNIQQITEIGIVSPAYPVFSVKENSALFLTTILNNDKKVINGILRQKAGGTRFSLPFKKLCKIEIPWPTIDERNQFMNFVRAFENKMETEKKILSKYLKHKKYLLSNLFI